ncbi:MULTISPECIES: hypothetical protein [unclassified Microcoleus]|uniref:hypothetical protein n=1 Tax=unclassified Microcoleus TaxID=2642155 RepID=UPI002FD4311C
MSQQSAPATPRSQFLTYSWDRPIAIKWYRDAVFDGISHFEAFACCIDSGIGVKTWLDYYQVPVLLPEQCDALYGVEPKTTDRLIRYFDPQLRGDGMFWCPETHLPDAEEALSLCWIGRPSLNFLLPPRAVLKLACFMPATTEVVRVLTCLEAIANKAYEPLSDRPRMSQNYRSTKERLDPKDKNFLVQEAKEKGCYAYAKHFGDWNSGVTYRRLLVHYERGGQFPPTRQELNDLLLEF